MKEKLVLMWKDFARYLIWKNRNHILRLSISAQIEDKQFRNKTTNHELHVYYKIFLITIYFVINNWIFLILEFIFTLYDTEVQTGHVSQACRPVRFF
jgi:hypothetical protein